jgi:hypothetical protein
MIPVEKAKEIREDLDLIMMVVFGMDRLGNQVVVTDGKTIADAECANNVGNELKNYLEWPEERCNHRLPERKCGNCHYWENLAEGHDMTHGYSGLCCFNPVKSPRDEYDIACAHIEPLK